MPRTVNIIVTNNTTGDHYIGRSYPDSDYDNNGKTEYYKIPVYYVHLEGMDSSNKKVTLKWKALRFMPYWNDPKQPDKRYRHRGWVNSGKHKVSKKKVTYYNPNYKIHNTYSPYDGAIQIEDSFLVHAGPASLSEYGWGAAGCVEIIGGFDKFKSDIQTLAGIPSKTSDAAIQALVKAGQLYIQVDYAAPPDIKSAFYGEY
ncbi:hypothetical protein LQ567_22275 [Niabella pedocola]|uniref:YkuD domain-containing protein n=1 Tax=Niabella pedocola TaxID=1752077 RepID=A0ABS8PWS4_9BACT|nr:hypothetical protein [Niabella pedocola]MCD2425527.1 hypothetical protein [Niabella pedocola]